jgi:hypothetical protein
VASRAVLWSSRPVTVSRRLTGVPAARLADRSRMRRSPPYLDQFIPANHLKTGERLKTPNGTLATADGGTTPKVHDGWMWDLTVPGNNDHDFYVLPAQTGSHYTHQVVTRAIPVLVHNCGNEVGTQVDYSDTGNDLVNATRNQRLADGPSGRCRSWQLRRRST